MKGVIRQQSLRIGLVYSLMLLLASFTIAFGQKVDPKLVTQPAGISLYPGDRLQLVAEGQRLWNDKSLGNSGLACGSTVTVAVDNVSTGTGGGTTHTVGHEGGGLYDISIPVHMPPASYAVFKIDNSA